MCLNIGELNNIMRSLYKKHPITQYIITLKPKHRLSTINSELECMISLNPDVPRKHFTEDY